MRPPHLLQRRTRFIAFVAASIDGRISLSEKTLPRWTSREDRRFFQRSLSRADTVVVGRNTYTAAAKRLRKRDTFVLSNSLATMVRRGSVTFVNPANVDLTSLLAKYKTVAVLGGGAVYRFMLESGLLDEIFITVEPLIFGRGKEMFIGGIQTARVNLLSVKRLNRIGTLLLHYRINQRQP
ncbi:MAG: dihydrofolate reductase family protein [Candidatus Komeilibacteria bacterium]|nr:dihydrofolate reductase family protein [Candidatus Komeilibacteria bacterium]